MFVCPLGRRVCLRRTGSLCDITGYGQKAGGTHPTGMHTFLVSATWRRRLSVVQQLSAVVEIFAQNLQSTPYFGAHSKVSPPEN